MSTTQLFTEAQVTALEKRLSGTCDSFEGALEYLEIEGVDATDGVGEFVERSRMELCAECGWWAEDGDWGFINNDAVCRDCNPKIDEEAD